MLSEFLLIGQVLRPQGIRGEVKVRPDTDDPWRFEEIDFVFLKQQERYSKVRIEDVRVREDGVYLRLDGASCREDAEKQRGLLLYIDRAHARKLAENETFICDLIGCRAIGTDGEEIGILQDVLQPGGNDVYVIKTPKGRMLLPALLHVVPEVNTEMGIIRIETARLPEVAVCEWEP